MGEGRPSLHFLGPGARAGLPSPSPDSPGHEQGSPPHPRLPELRAGLPSLPPVSPGYGQSTPFHHRRPGLRTGLPFPPPASQGYGQGSPPAPQGPALLARAPEWGLVLRRRSRSAPRPPRRATSDPYRPLDIGSRFGFDSPGSRRRFRRSFCAAGAPRDPPVPAPTRLACASPPSRSGVGPGPRGLEWTAVLRGLRRPKGDPGARSTAAGCG